MNLMRRGHHLIMKLRWQEIRHHALKVVATPTIATPSRDVIIRLAELNVAKKITNPKNLPGFQLGIDSQKKKTNIVFTALPKVVITLQNFTVIHRFYLSLYFGVLLCMFLYKVKLFATIQLKHVI